MAQNEEQVNTNVVLVDDRPSFMVHYYPLTHLHYFRPSLKLGLEPKLSKKWGVNVGLGYLNENLYILGNTDNVLADHRVTDLNGYYVSIEPKFYPFVNVIGKKSSTFVSFSFEMHDQDESREEWVNRFGGAFRQNRKFNRTEQSYTQMINMGTTLAKWSVINFNFSVGMGHRFIKIGNDLEEDAESLDPDVFSRSEKISGDLSRFAVKLSLFLTFPATENGHQAN